MRDLSTLRDDLLKIIEEVEQHRDAARTKGLQALPWHLEHMSNVAHMALNHMIAACAQESQNKLADKQQAALSGRAE